MPNTKWHYTQMRPYVPVYYVWRSWQDAYHTKRIGRIGTVTRSGSTWTMTLLKDPLIEGKGRTRDAAVDDAIQQIGGLD